MNAPQGSRPGKKLPKRTGRLAHKERRARSWARGQERKAARRAEQARCELANAKHREDGELTPWELARYERSLRRHPELAVTS